MIIYKPMTQQDKLVFSYMTHANEEAGIDKE